MVAPTEEPTTPSSLPGKDESECGSNYDPFFHYASNDDVFRNTVFQTHGENSGHVLVCGEHGPINLTWTTMKVPTGNIQVLCPEHGSDFSGTQLFGPALLTGTPGRGCRYESSLHSRPAAADVESFLENHTFDNIRFPEGMDAQTVKQRIRNQFCPSQAPDSEVLQPHSGDSLSPTSVTGSAPHSSTSQLVEPDKHGLFRLIGPATLVLGATFGDLKFRQGMVASAQDRDTASSDDVDQLSGSQADLAACGKARRED